MTFNYYYKNEAELFNFYRIPKILFTDKHFSKLSSDAKLVYSYMTTENENTALEEIAEFLGMSKEKVEKALTEIKKML